MNGMMTGDVARAIMADRQREFAGRPLLERSERPQRGARLLKGLSGLLAQARRPRRLAAKPVRISTEAA